MRPAKGAPASAPDLRNYNVYATGHASILSGKAIDRTSLPKNLPELRRVAAKAHVIKGFTFSLFFSIIYVNTFTLREI
jgi:hypothetical protein